ncbi:hypothetical protein SAMN06273570_5035 [Candidatus Pantoea floridensis]|uniref:Uncharacterized protein n=1 Tax=Candidatus Pantoea floridensis TaxID=1938870 RepID=A0A286DRC6_9GAMM|nr:hypothetical protein BX596_5008 [Enterobacteriaceae bacterium JKS000233]SOD61228.1 hypothetical protein SAMN06273570_5035 [Pantoea floridensis]
MGFEKSYTVRFAGKRGTQECAADLRTKKSEHWQRWLKTCLCLVPEEGGNLTSQKNFLHGIILSTAVLLRQKTVGVVLKYRDKLSSQTG